MQKKKPLNVSYEGMNYYKKKMILIYPDRIRVTVMRDIVKKHVLVVFYFNEKAYDKKSYKQDIYKTRLISKIKSDLFKKVLSW